MEISKGIDLLPYVYFFQVRLFGQKKVRTSLDDGDESGGKTIRKGGGASLALPKVRRNPLVEIIAINTGCLNQCTYCKVIFPV